MRPWHAGRTIGLIGSDLAGHPELADILRYILDQGGRFSLSSIRPEGLTREVIRLIAETGQKTATLAPEAASPGLKKVIGKEIPSERFYELVDQLVSHGIPNVRFYFMVGLPTETDEDAMAIVDFIMKSRKVFLEASRPRRRIGRLGVQLNPFIPKPWTPFQMVVYGNVPCVAPKAQDHTARAEETAQRGGAGGIGAPGRSCRGCSHAETGGFPKPCSLLRLKG